MRLLASGILALLLMGTAGAGVGPQLLPFAPPPGFTDSNYVSGLSNPTAMAWSPDGRLFVCEQGGRVRVVKGAPPALLATPFHTATVNFPGGTERGLLGIAFDPSFLSNGFVYIYYTNPSPAIHNCIRRLTASPPSSDVSTGGETVIADLENTVNTNHNGGAIHFGPDGKLYASVGEDAVASNAQSIGNRKGKILRYNSDGTIPANPTSFPGIAGTTSGPNQAIWAVGLRNPYTFAFQPGTGRMYINDVGQNTWEEINEGMAGRNFGWTGGSSDGNATSGNFTGSVYKFHHDGAVTTPSGCSITGGAFYNPSTVMFPASYVGKYFFADYCGNWIYYIDPASPGTSTQFATGVRSGPVDLTVGPDGALYYTANGGGVVGRIYYTSSTQSIVVSTNSLTITEGTSGSFTVRLNNAPAAPVTVNVAVTANTPAGTITTTQASVSIPVSNTPQTVNVNSIVTLDGVNETATITLSSSGLTNQTVSVTATDTGGSLSPTATISKPLSGDKVSGTTADFFGNGTVAPGQSPVPTVTKADFYVDGVLVSTDPANGSGHFHHLGGHSSWNTTTLDDGVHVVRMVVTDSNNRTGSDQEVIFVANGTAYAQDAAGDRLVVIEADRYSQIVAGSSGAAAGHAWTPTTAYGGQTGSYALQATPNDNVANINTGYALTSPRLDYLVDFTTTGTHYVWVRGWGPDGSSDSLHVGLDGMEVATSDRMTGFGTAWTWSNQTIDAVVASFNVPTTGVHAVSVWMREDGFVFDKLLLTTNAGLAAPAGVGPAISPGAPPLAGGGGSGKSSGGGLSCGLTGLEGVLILGLAAAFRRRRR